MKAKKVCTRCVFDDTVRNIKFDNDGVCGFCHLYDNLTFDPDPEYITKLFAAIKKRMRKKEHDCIVPFSGGVDSTYVLYCVKKAGLRPLAVHSDNGWVTDISRNNMGNTTRKLGVPMVTIKRPWDVMKDLYIAFLKASVPDVCLGCEVTSLSQMMEFAASEGIPYLFYGFSPHTEGRAPLSWHYVDGRYFGAIVKRFAMDKEAAAATNNLGILKMCYYLFIKGVKSIQLPIFVPWNEDKIKEILTKELGWVDGGRHSDCSFYPVVRNILEKKFNIDRRKVLYSAAINSGRMSRAEALRLLEEHTYDIKEKTDNALEKLGISREEFNEIMERPAKYFDDYPTYYDLLKIIKPLIRFACRHNLLLRDFYDKLFNAG